MGEVEMQAGEEAVDWRRDDWCTGRRAKVDQGDLGVGLDRWGGR